MAKPEPEVLEEKIPRWRSKFPAPLLRLLGLISFLPVYVASFFLALLISVPSFILTGRFTYLWDVYVGTTDFGNLYVGRDFPVVRGTHALYSSYNKKEITKIREYFGLD